MMRPSLCAAVLALALGSAVPAQAIRDSAFLGQIALVATDFCPAGAVPADGSLLSINYYQTLFALIGNSYGGKQDDGTFALPDLRGKEPSSNLLYCIVVNGIWPSK